MWDNYYKTYVASERAKGKKYVEDLFKGLRFSLGLPQVCLYTDTPIDKCLCMIHDPKGEHFRATRPGMK